MDSHLVTVKVGVECRTCERMQLDGLSFNHPWLECLDTETVEGRCTVEEHRMSLHHVFKYVPDDRILAVNNLLCGLYGLYDTALDELADDKWLVKFGSHIFRQTALVHVEFRANDDNRTCRIIDTLTEEVLTETSLLSLE